MVVEMGLRSRRSPRARSRQRRTLHGNINLNADDPSQGVGPKGPEQLMGMGEEGEERERKTPGTEACAGFEALPKVLGCELFAENRMFELRSKFYLKKDPSKVLGPFLASLAHCPGAVLIAITLALATMYHHCIHAGAEASGCTHTAKQT